MALVDNAWYVDYGDGSTTGYYAVTKWATGATIAAGALRRQNAAPAVGSERVFVCIVAGTTHASTEPTWVTTRGGKTTDNTVTWQECTGVAALNGDLTNTPNWTTVKNTSVTLGQVIQRNNGASYQICTTAGTAGNGSEPAFSNTAGTTTADNTVTWTSLGVVGNFTGWQAPHARLSAAFTATWGQAGNSFFIASEHAETQSTALTLTSPGTAASPCFAYSVTKTTVPPASANLSAGASITTTGASNLLLQGHLYLYGATLNCTSGNNTAGLGLSGGTASCALYLDNCALVIPGTSTSSVMQWGGSTNNAHLLVLNNTTVKFGSTSQSIRILGGPIYWQDTASAINTGGSIPTSLFGGANNQMGSRLFVTGVDLSGTTGTLVAASGTPYQVFMTDCKLGAAVTVAATPTDNAGSQVDIVRCDSGATNYRTERYRYEGTQTVETTIVRTGGATDGTTPISWKLVTTANSKWRWPLISQPITIWNDSTSAITTLTIYGTTTGGGVPKDDEIWVEVEYLGASGSPLGSFITSTKADNLAASAATNNSSDGSTWAGGGAGNGFKIVVPSFTPGQKGPINITIKAAKASTTYYIDPKPVI
jgi:hypothetical protein